MAELSPSAQAVMVAAFYQDHPNAHHVLAAALRAAADQVVPEKMDLPPIAPDLGHFRQHERRQTRRKLLAIAAELEAP